MYMKEIDKTKMNDSSPMNWIKGFVQKSEKVTKYNKHLKKAGKYNGWNIVSIRTKISMLVQITSHIMKVEYNCCSKKIKSYKNIIGTWYELI